jgi:hypothetical protein
VLLTGILITALSVIFMIVSVAGVLLSDSDKGFALSAGSYLVCAIGYISGLTLVAIGIAQELGWV